MFLALFCLRLTAEKQHILSGECDNKCDRTYVLQDHEEEEEEEEELRGFDRLRGLGMSATEIEQLRQQFHSHRYFTPSYHLHYLTHTISDTDASYLQHLEEEWINTDVSTETGTPNTTSLAQWFSAVSINEVPRHFVVEEEATPVGSTEDLFKGIVMGFLLGIIMLLWVRQVHNHCADITVVAREELDNADKIRYKQSRQ